MHDRPDMGAAAGDGDWIMRGGNPGSDDYLNVFSYSLS